MPLPLNTYLDQIIAFPSVESDAYQLNSIINYFTELFRRHGLNINAYINNGIPSLIASSAKTKSYRVLLQAHVDVVPAKPEGYKMQEKDGKYIGRGVYDMKFAAACYLKLADELKDELDQYDFGIMLTTDEEIGGENGVKYLLDHGYSTDVCIMPDGGDNWAMEVISNGLWFIKLKSRGRSAHGSRPWEGDCAINHLIDALNEVRELFGDMNPECNTMTISEISGGTAINQVADYAEASIDMRFLDHEQYLFHKEKIESITKKYNLEIETVAQVNNFITDTEEPDVAYFLSVVERIRGEPVKLARSLGASDARYFAEKNIPTILIRPEGGGAHSDHEWIDKAGLDQFYEVIKAYVTEVAKVR